MKIKLTSHCNVKGSVGVPGETVEASESLAKRLIEGRGAIDPSGKVVAGKSGPMTSGAESEATAKLADTEKKLAAAEKKLADTEKKLAVAEKK